MIPAEIHKPRPVPFRSFVVKNGSKILLITAGSIPWPVSTIEMRMPGRGTDVPFARMISRPPIRIASIALAIRLFNTWRMSFSKQSIFATVRYCASTLMCELASRPV